MQCNEHKCDLDPLSPSLFPTLSLPSLSLSLSLPSLSPPSPQMENGKTLGDHEQGSVMEHLRLLLAMVLSLLRPRAEAPGPGEWQEDSGLGLYRAPEEGGSAGAGAGAGAGASVSLETKVGHCCSLECFKSFHNYINHGESKLELRKYTELT